MSESNTFYMWKQEDVDVILHCSREHVTADGFAINSNFLLELAEPQKWVSITVHLNKRKLNNKLLLIEMVRYSCPCLSRGPHASWQRSELCSHPHGL